uniref:Uncharacterized protein n=1 Tax=Percolomonas cosmopolitus TaxID=63605 RepID=A0A7S1KTF1_9EUKA|mmetsp:Transcript_8862/g.32715  ORF Transcript_8862/g.32715 Transcript_8862/m.32715 type:complete len:224 (+) Transcript_8862:237-908(+)|eukprot:CAMPEP_0117446698 /NCGR_PEP_ID=MMETSP0759-20121206/6483_1 /TAXON_ID=63605 /ORGANISM="Percolomonas cosmopolitus, Strain WS" /LENGTH=223 /DNA_ID=CAMNT_0005238989 /DNA_START=220 /DNA_END=891 /DNA_ORIENTATION=+
MTSKRLQPVRPRRGRPIAGSISDTPPPGNYNIPSCFDTQKYKGVSIKSRPKSRGASASGWGSVGPGAYDQSYGTIGKSGPRFSMGSRASSRMGGNADTPSPGTYDQSYGTLSASRRGFSIGARLSSRGSGSDSPGPGNYTIRSSIGREGTHPTFKGRTKNRVTEQRPSPADYNIKGSIGTAPGATLKSRSFIKTTSMVTPGVGSYSLPSSFDAKKGPIFGTGD